MTITKEFTVLLEDRPSGKSLPSARRPRSEHARPSILPDWTEERDSVHG